MLGEDLETTNTYPIAFYFYLNTLDSTNMELSTLKDL